MVKARLLGAVGIVAVVGSVLTAQTPASPAFEVASVKPNNSGTAGGFFGFQGGQLRVTNLPLRTLISLAYGDPQVPAPIILIGEPGWLGSDRFDIVAKAEGNFPPTGPPPEQRALMLRSLLAERFNLIVHSETRELPIYELVLARADGKLGPQLHKSEVDCVALRESQQAGGPPPPPPSPSTASSPRPMCDSFGGFGRIVGGGTSIDQLTGMLKSMVNRTVVNKTGLTGNYDFDLTFTPDVPAPPPGSPLLPPGFDPNGPPIYTAIQEQLGLKLNPQKGPGTVIVIDKVEHPTPD